MTVPQISEDEPGTERVAADSEIDTAALHINKALLQAFTTDAEIGARYSVMDLRAAMPQWSVAAGAAADSRPVHNASGHWDLDWVHFSVAGYEHIGQLVFDAIEKNQLLPQAAAAAAAASS